MAVAAITGHKSMQVPLKALGRRDGENGASALQLAMARTKDQAVLTSL